MSDEDAVQVYTFDEFGEELKRQREKFRWSYRLRWIFGWPLVALVLRRSKTGWYLMAGNTLSGLCSTSGPFSTKAHARDYNRRQHSGFYFGCSDVYLLWEPPPKANLDFGWRQRSPWYRLPAWPSKK